MIQVTKTCTQCAVLKAHRTALIDIKKNLSSISMLGDSLPTEPGCPFRSSYVLTFYQRTSAKLQKKHQSANNFFFFQKLKSILIQGDSPPAGRGR